MKMKQKQANVIDVAVGQRVRALRLERRMSQSDLGNAVGITFQQIQKYEKGMNRMGASRLQQFADIFKVGVPDLFGQAAEQTDKNSLFNLVDGGGAVRLLRAYNAMQENGMRIALVRLAETIAGKAATCNRARSIISSLCRRLSSMGCEMSGKPKLAGSSMLKSELVGQLAKQNPHLFRRDVERLVSAIFDEIVRALARGDRVELRGFGVFSVRVHSARAARNPRTGTPIAVERKAHPYFKVGKEMRKRLNRQSPDTGQ